MLAPRVNNRPYFAALLLALVVLAWLSLWAWGQSPYARFLDHGNFGEMELGATPQSAGVLGLFVLGWTVMTFAMMLPTSLPLITMFRKMTVKRSDSAFLVTLLIAGYIAIWAAFGVAAHIGDIMLHETVNHWHWLEDHSQIIVGGTVLVAGVYQFTPLKYQCLDKCRSPMSFITEHWTGKDQQVESLRLGLHHGLFCVGCCWSLMLLMFAVGTGSVGWMLALGAIMAIEKNMPWGKKISMPLGGALIGLGIALIIFAAPEACAHNVSC